METIDIQALLDKWEICMSATEIIKHWSESWRKYHTVNHLNDLIHQIKNHPDLDTNQKEMLYITAIFHDIVYIPNRNDNEFNSMYLLIERSKNASKVKEIAKIILETIDHKASSPLSHIFLEMDMDIVKRNYDELLAWEEGIEFEYNFMPKEKYKHERIKFLEKTMTKYPKNAENLSKLITCVQSK